MKSIFVILFVSCLLFINVFGEKSRLLSVLAAGQQCGTETCPPKQECCNPTCNWCVPKGWSCTQQDCGDGEGHR